MLEFVATTYPQVQGENSGQQRAALKKQGHHHDKRATEEMKEDDARRSHRPPLASVDGQSFSPTIGASESVIFT